MVEVIALFGEAYLLAQKESKAKRKERIKRILLWTLCSLLTIGAGTGTYFLIKNKQNKENIKPNASVLVEHLKQNIR